MIARYACPSCGGIVNWTPEAEILAFATASGAIYREVPGTGGHARQGSKGESAGRLRRIEGKDRVKSLWADRKSGNFLSMQGRQVSMWNRQGKLAWRWQSNRKYRKMLRTGIARVERLTRTEWIRAAEFEPGGDGVVVATDTTILRLRNGKVVKTYFTPDGRRSPPWRPARRPARKEDGPAIMARLQDDLDRGNYASAEDDRTPPHIEGALVLPDGTIAFHVVHTLEEHEVFDPQDNLL